MKFNSNLFYVHLHHTDVAMNTYLGRNKNQYVKYRAGFII